MTGRASSRSPDQYAGRARNLYVRARPHSGNTHSWHPLIYCDVVIESSLLASYHLGKSNAFFGLMVIQHISWLIYSLEHNWPFLLLENPPKANVLFWLTTVLSFCLTGEWCMGLLTLHLKSISKTLSLNLLNFLFYWFWICSSTSMGKNKGRQGDRKKLTENIDMWLWLTSAWLVTIYDGREWDKTIGPIRPKPNISSYGIWGYPHSISFPLGLS